MFAFRSRPAPDPGDDPSFSPALRGVLKAGRDEAVELAHDSISPEHLVLAMLRDPRDEAGRLLTAAGADPRDARARVLQALQPGTTPARTAGELSFTSRALRILDLAMEEARTRGGEVTPAHLLVAIALEPGGVAAGVLREMGVTPAALRAAAQAGEVADSTFRPEIDESSDRSIFEQIVAGVQEAVATGRLRAGERLPSVRRMADQLDVAPGTVARAYGELERLGVVVTEGARGTRVAQRPAPAPNPARAAALDGMMRNVAIAAFHMGATEAELREALDRATREVLTHRERPDDQAA